MFYKSLLTLTLVLATAANASANTTRTRVEDYSVMPGAHVNVKINGGPINVKAGAAGKVHVELVAVANASSEKELDELIAKAQPIIEQKGQQIRVVLHDGDHGGSWSWWHSDNGVHFRVNLIVPTAVDLDLDTSGGPINVDGEVQGEVHVHTSGGPISITGATGKLDLDTSGGGITVDRVLQQLHADTSGGSIQIGYVGPDVVDINADTSGGNISIGLDAAGNYDLDADTSGGNVSINGLSFDASRQDRTHAEGRINRGGARVRADTSGGNVDIHAAHR
ncbi:MAG TPA: DUF4097 family beta strand repeat-containing protein [Steroidobacteraceae bacterium]|nr:DUF4097 family beta strand repeat-containing protein [Steroidobacteraceae bacterium]